MAGRQLIRNRARPDTAAPGQQMFDRHQRDERIGSLPAAIVVATVHAGGGTDSTTKLSGGRSSPTHWSKYFAGGPIFPRFRQFTIS
jgi:hypothetical protein